MENYLSNQAPNYTAEHRSVGQNPETFRVRPLRVAERLSRRIAHLREHALNRSCGHGFAFHAFCHVCFAAIERADRGAA